MIVIIWAIAAMISFFGWILYLHWFYQCGTIVKDFIMGAAVGLFIVLCPVINILAAAYVVTICILTVWDKIGESAFMNKTIGGHKR